MGMTVLVLERQAPIAVNPYRPPAALLSPQFVQPKPRHSHVLDALRRIQGRKQHSQPLRVVGLNTSDTAGFEEPS